MKKNKKKLKSYFPRPNTTEYKKKKYGTLSYEVAH